MTHGKSSHIHWAIVTAGMILGCWVVDVCAAEPISGKVPDHWFDAFQVGFSRPIWDTLMRWVNFIILAAVIYKYAKAPVVSFLKEKRAETALSIEQLEKKKRAAEEKIRQGRIQLQASQERLVSIKERIVSEGQRRKAQIIEQAHQESQRMLDGARLKIDSRIREAYNAVRLELIDMAAEKAADKLSRMITKNDQVQLVGQWMDAAQK